MHEEKETKLFKEFPAHRVIFYFSQNIPIFLQLLLIYFSVSKIEHFFCSNVCVKYYFGICKKKKQFFLSNTIMMVHLRILISNWQNLHLRLFPKNGFKPLHFSHSRTHLVFNLFASGYLWSYFLSSRFSNLCTSYASYLSVSATFFSSFSSPLFVCCCLLFIFKFVVPLNNLWVE